MSTSGMMQAVRLGEHSAEVIPFPKPGESGPRLRTSLREDDYLAGAHAATSALVTRMAARMHALENDDPSGALAIGELLEELGYFDAE